MAGPSLFDYLKHINESGGDRDLLFNPDNAKGYAPFMINRGVAQSLNTVLFAEELNKHVVVDKEMHYAFLFHSVKKTKRYAKWAKKEEVPEDILMIQQIYQVNIERAMEFSKLLSPEDIQSLKDYNDKGGQIGRGKKL